MKIKMLIPAALLSVALLFSGCAADGYNSGAKEGAVAGGALGAIGGAIIGNQSGRALEGAAIGGATGAVAGGLLGSAQDDKARRRAAANAYHYDARTGYYRGPDGRYYQSPPPGAPVYNQPY